MDMLKNHPRYREISIGSIDGNGADQAKLTIGIVLFKSDKKLRSHAVKHLTNLQEFGKTWGKIKNVEKELVLSSIANLQEIECPQYSIGIDPTCHTCNKFHLCSEFIYELENEYINLIWRIIEEGSVIPLYVGYFSNDIENLMFVLMPERPIVIKAALLEDDSFNLMTCYSDAARSFIEMRDYQADKVRREARNDSIIWCEEITWELGAFTPHRNVNPKKGRKKKKSGQKSQPFNRGGSRSWRQYLN